MRWPDRIRIEREPRDMWVGLYWKRYPFGGGEAYICVVPMLPLHLSWGIPNA